MWHAARLLALEEGHASFAMDPVTLESCSAWRYDGALEGPVTAHPTIDPEREEMLLFGYMTGGPFSPDVTYTVHRIPSATQYGAETILLLERRTERR